MATAFFWDEQTFWHAGGNYALTVPVGGLVQPMAAGGLPESPETKRRLKNLIDVTGLIRDLDARTARPADRGELLRVHDRAYLDRFKAVSDAGGGELGQRTPFGPGGYEIAALSAGLVRAALEAVLDGNVANAYALSRPPGHHCLPDTPMGFCLLANIAIAIEDALAARRAGRIAVLDWDVHHGNGTEAIFYNRADVLTVSIHQDHNYPLDKGDFADRGTGAGTGYNLNIPLPPGAGHASYLEAMERLALPAIRAFRPDAIVVACGYDASGVDPLSRMLATADTFRQMTRLTLETARDICGGRVMMAHEGGYSEVHVPFCGHAVLEEMSGSAVHAPDPLQMALSARQPSARATAFVSGLIGEMAEALAAD